MKILIADDDNLTRLLLSSALTKLGHEVFEEASGREAWGGGRFPLLISDWMVHEGSGRCAARNFSPSTSGISNEN